MKQFLPTSLKKALLAILLFSASLVNAQAPVTGYDYLGACNGHHYYISSTFSLGTGINNVVADFRSKVATPASQVYAAAIVNAAENACITSLMINYNTGKYGTPLATGTHWFNSRNAWIGLTDIMQEGNFTWSNNQDNCQDYRNWNIHEPNNFFGTTSNGEDYTQILIMKPYSLNGVINDPLGKWNDYYNEDILDSEGQAIGKALLPVIIEVGPADCEPVKRGDKGCSQGYWRNSNDKAWENAGYGRANLFATVFGVTNDRGVINLLTTTMQQAVTLGGDGYNNVARQGVAALLNAASSFYPYTEAEIKTAVKNMFNNGAAALPAVSAGGTNFTGGVFTTSNALAAYLDKLNNLGCPLNNHGDSDSDDKDKDKDKDRDNKSKYDKPTLDVNCFPNPSGSNFTLKFSGHTTERLFVRVTDTRGRIIEEKSNIQVNQLLTIGNNYRPGLYILQVRQGDNRKELKLVKF